MTNGGGDDGAILLHIMKFRSKETMTGLLLVLGGLHPPCQMNADSEWTVPSRNTAMEVVTDFGKYYDVNGDGKMEYLSGGALGALSTEADGSWVFRCWRVGSGGSRILGVGPDGKVYSMTIIPAPGKHRDHAGFTDLTGRIRAL